jgi:nitroreductase
MDLFKAIYGRRSVRKYKDQPVEDEKLQKVLEACRAAPSSKNGQPWEFILIRSKKTLKAISKETAYAKFLAHVPLGVAIVLDPNVSQTYHMVDSGIMTENFWLAAYALGLGTCWVGTMNRDKVKEILNTPKEKVLLTVLPLGYAQGKLPQRPQKALNDLEHQEKY